MEHPNEYGRGRLGRAAIWALRGGVTLAAVLALYLAAILGGALVTGAQSSRPGGEEIIVYVSSNGFHTDLILPERTAVRDWSDILRLSPITRERMADTRWIAFGWGSETAYTRLGRITDLSPAIALKALAFDRSVVHVAPFSAIREGSGIHRIRLTSDGYRRLVEHVEASFAEGEDGEALPLAGLSHGYGDAFFRGRGRFSFLRGCNVWTGEALRAAGHETGIWTPFAQSLIWSAGL